MIHDRTASGAFTALHGKTLLQLGRLLVRVDQRDDLHDDLRAVGLTDHKLDLFGGAHRFDRSGQGSGECAHGLRAAKHLDLRSEGAGRRRGCSYRTRERLSRRRISGNEGGIGSGSGDISSRS